MKLEPLLVIMDNGLKIVRCPTCNGTGNVHSHNPTCWDCGGTGRLTQLEVDKVKHEARNWTNCALRNSRW